MDLPSFERTSTVPLAARAVVIVALAKDAVLIERSREKTTLPRLVFDELMPLEALIKTHVFATAGGLVEKTQMIGTIGNTIVYSAKVCRVERHAQSPNTRSEFIHINETRILVESFGDSVEEVLTLALKENQ